MKKNLLILAIALISTQCYSQNLKTHKDSLSYALGVSMAESLKKSGISDYNENIFMEAVKAQLNGKSGMDAATADKLYREEQKKAAETKSLASKKVGEDYLMANKSKPGVMTTASGLQYKTTVEGTGAMPDANDKVTVHYHGTLIDGTIFDSSVDRGQPASFGLNQVIPGWTEGLQLMKEGGKTTFYIPFALAYGARGQGKIGPYATLIFDVELIKVEKVDGASPQQPQRPQTPPAPPAPPAPASAPAPKK